MGTFLQKHFFQISNWNKILFVLDYCFLNFKVTYSVKKFWEIRYLHTKKIRRKWRISGFPTTFWSHVIKKKFTWSNFFWIRHCDVEWYCSFTVKKFHPTCFAKLIKITLKNNVPIWEHWAGRVTFFCGNQANYWLNFSVTFIHLQFHNVFKTPCIHT
jgi:hypothetical protein